jgi:Zn-finger nucleic acid-binding protein
MNCPKCRDQAMNPEVYEEVSIERCPVCKGMFFHKGEIRELIEKQQGNVADDLRFSPTSDMMDAVEAHCFLCREDMVQVKTPGDVVINECPKCKGIFLDQGELATLQQVFS